VDASGGLRGGTGGTNGAGGTITLTADFVTLNQTTTTGMLSLHAPTVRLEGALSFGSLDPMSVGPTVVQVGVATATSTGGSIQTAIDIAADDVTTIMLDAGTFHERGILLDKRVDIVGAGSNAMTGSIIDASGASGFTGRGNIMDGLTVTVGGANAMNTVSLQGFAVTNAMHDGIVLDRGGGMNTIAFIALSNVAARMNGNDGLAITGTGTVTDLALSNVTLMSNTGNGLHVAGGTIAPQSDVMGSFGMLIDSSTIASNATDGIRIEADATDVILKGDIIADNDGDGVFIAGTVDDLVIQDSHLGAIDVDGNPITTGDNFSREPQ
jgi:hypothetical protein